MTNGSGDLDSIKALAPVDATTNPSLILAAVSDPKFAALVDEAIKSAKGATTEEKVCCRVLHWHWVVLSCNVL